MEMSLQQESGFQIVTHFHTFFFTLFTYFSHNLSYFCKISANIIIFSSAFALWANAELYILVPSLTDLLTDLLTDSGRKLEKSLNFDARTLKFCMNHPWMQSLRFRENQIVCMSLSLLVGLLPY